MIPYGEILREQSKPIQHPRLRRALLLLAASATIASGAIYAQDQSLNGTTTEVHVGALGDLTPRNAEADKIVELIQRVGRDPDLRDEDEPPPPPGVSDEAIRLIRAAMEMQENPMPPGRVSTFFGELNVAWRSDDKIVRLACFPNRDSVIQSGSLSAPLGSYRSEPKATAEKLAEALDLLVAEEFA